MDNRPLQKMFRAVPPSYDLLNRVLTFGIDQVWRRRAAVECFKDKPEKVLDLCTGTGDLVIHLAKMVPPPSELVTLDYSQPMLDRAKTKAEKRGIDNIRFVYGDAASMPFDDNYFDSVAISFAFRNLTFHNPDRDKFLREILRVLKPGGKFVIVETSQPKNRLLRSLFHIYLKTFTAYIGGWISGHHGAYKYLAHSARLYYSSEQLEELLINSGFLRVTTKLLMGGIAGIFICYK